MARVNELRLLLEKMAEARGALYGDYRRQAKMILETRPPEQVKRMIQEIRRPDLLGRLFELGLKGELWWFTLEHWGRLAR